MENQQVIILVRGISGSGKSTFAKQICNNVASADDYFMKDGEYQFDPKKLKDAHSYCLQKTIDYLDLGESVAVANTFTEEWEMKPYFDLAARKGIMIFSVVVENRHGGKNIHGVPANVIARQSGRFQIKLV